MEQQFLRLATARRFTNWHPEKGQTMTLADEDTLGYEDMTMPLLSPAEERAATAAGVRAGLADVEAGRTMPLEDYKTQVLAMRHMRDARKPR